MMMNKLVVVGDADGVFIVHGVLIQCLRRKKALTSKRWSQSSSLTVDWQLEICRQEYARDRGSVMQVWQKRSQNH